MMNLARTASCLLVAIVAHGAGALACGHGGGGGGGSGSDPYANLISDAADPAVATSGAASLVAFALRKGDGTGAVAAVRVAELGRVLDASPIVLASNTDSAAHAAVAPAADGWAVAWQERGAISSAMVASDGTVSAPLLLASRGDYDALPAIAAGGGGFLVVWMGSTADGQPAVLGIRLDGTGAGPVTTLATQGSFAGHPSVASDGTRFLVVWPGAAGDGPSGVVGRRFDARLGAVDAAPIAIGPSTGARMSATWDGAGFLVAWEDETAQNVEVTSVGADGRVGPSLVIAGAQDGQLAGPRISSDGNGAFVAWQDGSGNVLGRAILRDGTLGTTTTPVASATSGVFHQWPALAPAPAPADGYLAVFESIAGHSEIHGTRTSSDGATILDGNFAVVHSQQPSLFGCSIAAGQAAAPSGRTVAFAAILFLALLFRRHRARLAATALVSAHLPR